ncbi:MAG: alpha/beta hydrolase [Flavobacterium sp.]|nr:alpha/beta hydrolase [Flavobacterium sp.]
MKYKTIKVDNLDIFYREAGNPSNPKILLLHGFPSSSRMFNELMVSLSKDYHLIAPDYPGFGQSSSPSTSDYKYTFDNLASTISKFIDLVGFEKFSIYVQDYGGPVGFRIATQRPSAIQAIIVQNANAYLEGFGEATKALNDYVMNPNAENEKPIRDFMTLEGTKWQYTDGAENILKINPDSYITDQYYLDRPGNKEIQLELVRNYGSNVALYDTWHNYFRIYQPLTLVISGKNDKLFIEKGAIAYKKDIKNAQISLLNGGHFVLEEKHKEAAQLIKDFLRKNLKK